MSDVTKFCGLMVALLALLCLALGLSSCGITRASIVQPKDGSVTSITITTNNPISTNVDPTINADLKK